MNPSDNGDKGENVEKLKEELAHWKKQYSESSKGAMELAHDRNALVERLTALEEKTRAIAEDKTLDDAARAKLLELAESGKPKQDNDVLQELSNLKAEIGTLKKDAGDKLIEEFRKNTKLDSERTLADLTEDEWEVVRVAIGEKMRENHIDPNAPVTEVPAILRNTWKLVKDEIDLNIAEPTSELGKMKGSPSSGSRSKTPTLSAKEEEVARKLGIDPAEYAKNKQ